MYEFGIGHYLFYPLGIFFFSAVFFVWGYRVGRRKERERPDVVTAPVGR